MADLDGFLADSRALVGKPAPDVVPGVDIADWISIRRFAAALGDRNLLWKDASGGAATRYYTMIAPPAFVLSVRTPTSAGAYESRDYGLQKFLTHATIEWQNVIRLGERIKSSITVSGASKGGSVSGRSGAQVTSSVSVTNADGGPLATMSGTTTAVPHNRGEDFILDRDIYRYSDEEIKKLEHDIEAEAAPRGKHVRFWDDVKAGEHLGTLVKGPMTLSDMMAWQVAEGKPVNLGAVVHNELKSKPGRVRTNPTTNWPFWDSDQEHEDILSCRNGGFKSPFSRGQQRVALASQVLTDWMGDDGFLRRLDVELPGHYLYGDAMWLKGEVGDKFKEQVGKERYHAVDVRLTGTNQLGETVLRGNAIVYLPNPGHPVALPVVG